MDIKGKLAVITGAGGGLGSRIVRLLKTECVITVLLEKDKSLLEGIKDILDGDSSFIYECDMGNPEAVQDTANKILSKFKKIDMLFNIAGVGIYKSLEELKYEEWKASIDINLNTPFILTKTLVEPIKKSGNGLVVNIGSGMGVDAISGRSAYCSSKFGLRGLSLSLSKEYKGKGINFILMTLGSMMTNFGTGGIEKRKDLQSQGKKYLDPDEVAKKIVDIIKSGNYLDEYVIYPEGYESSN